MLAHWISFVDLNETLNLLKVTLADQHVLVTQIGSFLLFTGKDSMPYCIPVYTALRRIEWGFATLILLYLYEQS
jgi:hypothetical protein